MMTFAAGSAALMALSASIPFTLGMTISIVTRSGLSSWYLATASAPSAASPTMSCPPEKRIFFSSVLINIVSSTIRILPIKNHLMIIWRTRYIGLVVLEKRYY
ncbi:MAG: hypothetical protein BWX50_01170 [Euryarchaeota archaeon ADurb.Bin009]|nr:MAG: hypothetical protein BWX50_01170 [Euryarchaeota archaeon ADurb.Bin009]